MASMRQWLAAGLAMVATGVGAQPLMDAPPVKVTTSAAPDRRVGPADFGQANPYYASLDASSLAPYQSGFAWLRTASGEGVYCQGGATESRAVGEVRLPHGAALKFLRVWGVDSSGAQDLTATLDEVCLPDFDPGAPVRTTKATIVSSGSPGSFSLAQSIDGTVDAMSCTYRLTVQFDGSTTACSQGANLAFYRARVEYQRQTSAAPAVASFTDVPVGSAFHAEVEALKRSGITTGCTATQFCPSATLTRLQMAAFLARALGLQFDLIPDPANPPQ